MGKTSIHVNFYPTPSTAVASNGLSPTSFSATFQKLNIKDPATCAYHPQSNGKCERLNGVMGPPASTRFNNWSSRTNFFDLFRRYQETTSSQHRMTPSWTTFTPQNFTAPRTRCNNTQHQYYIAPMSRPRP
ncbi:hypothetical protein F5H01DRAFT_364112 [Linnemannia elongata]|nr:hypothetical protein F5H01DRAFT_364112 [Linnemannia elongata]